MCQNVFGFHKSGGEQSDELSSMELINVSERQRLIQPKRLPPETRWVFRSGKVPSAFLRPRQTPVAAGDKSVGPEGPVHAAKGEADGHQEKGQKTRQEKGCQEKNEKVLVPPLTSVAAEAFNPRPFGPRQTWKGETDGDQEKGQETRQEKGQKVQEVVVPKQTPVAAGEITQRPSGPRQIWKGEADGDQEKGQETRQEKGQKVQEVTTKGRGSMHACDCVLP